MMGWSIGYDEKNKRDIGYGVPCECDHPDCTKEIHRGLDYVCGGMPEGGENGCGLHFCHKHLQCGDNDMLCKKCLNNKAPFIGKPDLPEWTNHKNTDPSWAAWREEQKAAKHENN